MDQINVLYIHSHDTGRYVQPYGYAVSTPNIQKLAEEGILFRQAFSVAPTCSPSRAGLLTGQCPHSNGQFGLVNRGFELPDCNKHIVNTLKKEGYYSALIGLQHIRKDPTSIGYDYIGEVESNHVKHVVPKAVEFLKNTHNQPLFLSVGFSETHRVFPSHSTDINPNYCQPPAPLPDTPEIREDMADFKTSASILDKGIARVLKALEENGLTNNTLVICTTDHGIAFPTMKCNLTDHGIGVMLIMKGPHGFEGGKVCDALVSQIDIFPTICDLLDIEFPEWLEGNSIMPLVHREKKEINNEIFSEVNYHCSYEPMRAVRTKRWKYIRRYLNKNTPMLANCDPSSSKNVLLKNGWKEEFVDKEELYDLIFDPNESNNLANDPSKKDKLQNMRNKLDNWMQKTKDPLLKGEIKAPPGAKVNKFDDVEPNDIWEYEERPEGYA